jgi:hypothetical protein
MHTLSATAERLRKVRQAHKHFLSLWALDCLMQQQKPLEKMTQDVNRSIKTAERRDWSMLYRGSILDD